MSDIRISVSDIAFDVCPTNRNLYLAKIQGISSRGDPSRVAGKATEQLYFLIYDIVSKHVKDATQPSVLQKLDPWDLLQTQEPDLVSKAIEEAKTRCRKEDLDLTDFTSLSANLKKVLDFEAHLATSLVHHQLSRMTDHRVASFFDDVMHFALEPTYRAEPLGFSNPVKPDFVYAGKTVGDIKTGSWHDFLRLSLTAYALAYEYDRGRPMNEGLIHHVQFKDTHPVPLHYNTKVTPITNVLRTQFIARRDSKLAVLKDRRDPGKPSKEICLANDCPFVPHCWREE